MAVIVDRESYCPVLELLGLGRKPLDEKYIQELIEKKRRLDPEGLWPEVDGAQTLPLTGVSDQYSGLGTFQEVVRLEDGTFALKDRTARFVRGEIVQILSPDFDI